MACVSLSRSPLAPDTLSRSLPARSIRFSMPAAHPQLSQRTPLPIFNKALLLTDPPHLHGLHLRCLLALALGHSPFVKVATGDLYTRSVQSENEGTQSAYKRGVDRGDDPWWGKEPIAIVSCSHS